MKDKTLISIILWGLLFVTAAAVLWIFGKYVIIGIMPFIIAYAVSLAVRPLSVRLSEKTRTNRKFWAAVLVIIAIFTISLFISWLVSAVISEGQELVMNIADSLEDENNIIRNIIDFFSNLRERIPFLSRISKNDGSFGSSVYNGATELLKNSLTNISSAVASGAASLIGKLPGFIFALVTTVIAVFYISLDNGEIGKEITFFIGKKNASKLKSGRSRAVLALTKYLKSYMIIMLMTFAQLLLGFVVLDIKYSVLLAFIISLIDLLPVLGSGTVLVPWALVSLAVGKIKTGIGLLVLWGIMYIVRQIAEPHIIGSVMGIHPITSLFALYAGYVFFGVGGMVILPVAVYLAKVLMYEKNGETANHPEKTEVRSGRFNVKNRQAVKKPPDNS